MRLLLLALAVFIAIPAQSAEIFSVSSDKAAYSIGEVPALRASVATKPINPDFEFDVVGDLNEATLPVERVTDYEFVSAATGLTADTYTWEATLVIQDKRYARDLKASMEYFTGRITVIDGLLAIETDPDTIANLQAQKARYQSLLAGADSELSNIRTPVKTSSIQFTVQ